MASTAGHISRDLFSFDFRRLVAVCVPAGGLRVFGGRLAAVEDVTAHAVASAGLAALIALPFLLLWSVVVAVPLALPAVIGLGYLAVSHALTAQHRRRAAFINTIVLCGLVGWLLLFLLTGEGRSSQAGLTAALMAPLVAAAPAFARSLISARRERLPPVAPVLRDAALSPCIDGMVAMRLRDRAAAGPPPALTGVSAVLCPASANDVQQPHRPSCDVGEAMTFALRHAEPKAKAKLVVLTSAVDPSIVTACDRQVGRRILHHLIDCGLNGSQTGGAVHLLGRRLKGVVLLRVVSAIGADLSHAGADSDDVLDVAPLRALVEIAGGTLVVDREHHNIALSVRLDLAVERAPQMRAGEIAGAD